MRNFKKALATLLAVLMAMSTVSLVFAASPSDFSDFPDTWSAEAMTAAVNNGLITGFEDGTVRPRDLLTRAQMAAIINRALGATVKADIKGMFTDVSESDWFYEDIAKAVNMKTFSGDGAGHMNPNDPITRQDAFLVVGRALVLSSNDTKVLDVYSDKDDIASYAIKEITAMTGRGYIHGYEDGSLRPKNNITREEFAQLMHNIFSMYIRDGGNITLGDVKKGEVVLTGKEVTLKDTTINGDLIIGDGVGLSNLVLNNVKIKGRLLFRGAEDKVTMKNTTIGDIIVTNDVNGTIHFQHYSYEPLFKNAIYNTPATFLDRTVDGGSASGTGLDPTDTRADGNKDAGTGNGKPADEGTIYYGGGGSGGTNRALYYADYFEMNVDGTYPEERSYVYTSASTRVGKEVQADTTYQLPEGFELDEGNPNNVLNGVVEKGNTLRLKVYYRRKTVTLTFTPETGNPIEVTTRYGSTEYEPEIPDVPGKDGHTPIGWFDADDNEFDPDAPATEDKTYTPKYEVNNYTATFYPDVTGGDPVGTVTVPFNTTANENNVAIPDGSTLQAPQNQKFGHWYYMDGQEEKEFNADTKMPAGDIQVFPKWVDEDQVAYKIETYTQKTDGTYDKTTQTQYGYVGSEVQVEPVVPEHFELNLGQSVLEGVLSAETETVLKVYYDRQKHTVTFTDEGGAHDPIENVLYGAQIQLPEAKGNLVGVTFRYWSTAGDETQYAAGAQYEVNGNVTFTAVYQVNPAETYTVTFVDEGGDHDPIENVAAGAQIELPAAKGVQGKTFQYWEITGDTTQYAAGAQYEVNGNVTFTAVYEDIVTYTVTFVDEGGDHDPIENVEAGTVIQLPEPKGVEDKLFAGWTTDNTDSYAAGADYEVNGDVTFTAVYNDETVSVTFDYNDEDETPDLTITDIVKGSSLGEDFPEQPERDGYRFDGWFYEENEDKVAFTATTAINADLTVTAEWTLLITVVFCDNGANDRYAVVVGEGETVTEDDLTAAADTIPAARRSRNGYTADENISAVYAGEEKTHVVYNTWLYNDEDAVKTEFTVEVPITLDIAVDPDEYGYDYETPIVLVDYDANAVQTSIDAQPILGANGVITLNTWYFDKESRTLDTVKDSLFDETNKQFALTAFDVLIDKVPTDNQYVQMVLNDKNEIMNVSYNYRLMKLLGRAEIERMTREAMEEMVTSQDTIYNVILMILNDMAEDPDSGYWNTDIRLFLPYITNDMIRSVIVSLLNENPLSDEVVDAAYAYLHDNNTDLKTFITAHVDMDAVKDELATNGLPDAMKQIAINYLYSQLSDPTAAQYDALITAIMDAGVLDDDPNYQAALATPGVTERNATEAAVAQLCADVDQFNYFADQYLSNPTYLAAILDILFSNEDVRAAAIEHYVQMVLDDEAAAKEQIRQYVASLDEAGIGALADTLVADNTVKAAILEMIRADMGLKQTVVGALIDTSAKREQIATQVSEKMNQGTLDQALVDFLVETAETELGYDQYIADFMEAMRNGDSYEIFPENIFIITAVINKLNNTTYEYIKSKLPSALFKVFDEDLMRDLYNEAMDSYKADCNEAYVNALAGQTSDVPTFVKLTINPVTALLQPYYEKAFNKFEDTNIYQYYDANKYAKAIEELLRMDGSDGTLLKLLDPDEASEGASGYKLRTAEEYYEWVKKMAVLGDDMALWFADENNVPDTFYDDVIDVADEKILGFLDKLADTAEFFGSPRIKNAERKAVGYARKAMNKREKVLFSKTADLTENLAAHYASLARVIQNKFGADIEQGIQVTVSNDGKSVTVLNKANGKTVTKSMDELNKVVDVGGYTVSFRGGTFTAAGREMNLAEYVLRAADLVGSNSFEVRTYENNGYYGILVGGNSVEVGTLF